MGLRIRIRGEEKDGSRPLMSIMLWIEEEMGNHTMGGYQFTHIKRAKTSHVQF